MNNIFIKILNRYYYYTRLKPLGVKNRRKDFIHSGKNILIFATPRGGSTWLAEIFLNLPKSVLVHEPLRIRKKIPELNELNFWWHQYIPENEAWKEAHAYFHKLLNREIFYLSMYYENSMGEIPCSEYFIYKFCHGNLLLPWLVDNFNITPILLVRHPCAVVASQLSFGTWNFLNKSASFEFPGCRFNNYFEKYRSIFDKINYPEEYLAAIWSLCMVNSTMHPYNNKRWITVSYEKLFLDRESQLNEIVERLGLQTDITGWASNSKNPSRTTFSASQAYLEGGNQLSAWQKKLKPKQIDRIFRVINAFGIKFYTEDVEPIYSLIE